ncbi:hypothetical protein CC78DRAFT_421564, partial [Lojkania enalia]
GTVIVPLRTGSDGDVTKTPKTRDYYQVYPPTFYLEKLGMQWMKDRGEAVPGINYVLNALPAGYVLYKRVRPSNTKQVDKYLYGHPSGKYFDSPNRFYPHFKHLMSTGGGIGCPCTVCNAIGGQILPLKQKTTAPLKAGPLLQHQHQRGQPKVVMSGMDASRVDEEGNPDVYRNLVDKLRRTGVLDEDIEEPLSIDWVAEKKILPQRLREIEHSPQWHPRVGDIVLYVKLLPPSTEVCRCKQGDFKIWDSNTKTFLGHPAWEAGLIGQVPSEETDIDDLVMERDKAMSVSYSGIRIEPLPDPNSSDKSLSKRYTYLPIHHTRPFVFWKDILTNVPKERWHPTIKHALTAMATFSLWSKFRFKGQWPDAWIFSRGIYIGSEMLSVGDTIRLVPKADALTVMDVLIIKSIRLKLSNLDLASDNDYDEGRPYNSSICIFGSAYTLDQSRADGEMVLDGDPELPEAMKDYSRAWYPLHPPEKEMLIHLDRVLGRLYEYDAMSLWFPSLSPDKTILPPDLSHGLEGLMGARKFARKTDNRIVSAFGSNWYWGESRAQALDLQTINGLEVGKYDLNRDPKQWRQKLKAV